MGNSQEVTYRKCHLCKQPIEIKNNNIRGVVYYQNFYYHSSCFCEMAEERSKCTDKRKNPQKWQELLNNMTELEVETRKLLQQHWGDKEAKDELNIYLLSQYNVTTMPDRFWQVVADLSNGFYKKKRCKKVSTQTLLEAWRWGQRKLNEIDKHNKANHKGPADDNQRISYDLAILVKKIPNYLAYKAKQEAMQEEIKTTIRIDYNKMIRTDRKIEEGLDDISDLLDDDDD